MSENISNRNATAIPSIKPTQDEVASRRRSGRTEAPRQSNFNGVLVFVIVVMAIMMGVGGFTLYEVQLKLDQSNLLLEKGQQNMRELESRLAATGTDVSKTLETMQSGMDTTDFEIRKLWDVANKRNKNWIQENQSALTKLNTQNGDALKRVQLVEGNLRQIQERFVQVATVMENVRLQLLDDNDELSTQVGLVRGQVQDQAVDVEGNKRNLAIMKKDMEEVAQAIEAIDRYRLQLNRQLLDLQNKVQGGSAAQGG